MCNNCQLVNPATLYFLLLILSTLFRSTFCVSCDAQPLPELWFKLSGQQLNWPCASVRSIYESSGRYVGRNVIATRLQVYGRSAYLALPRFLPGVPFSLGVTSIKPKISRNSPSYIKPFPENLMAHEEGNCEALQSVVDLKIDKDGVLWVLDVGIVNGLVQPVRRCPPKIIAVDADNQEIVKVIDLSPLTNEYSRLQQLVVDHDDETGNDYIYVSDAANSCILVYDASEGTSSGLRVRLPSVVSEGCSFQDVLYLALVKKNCGTSVLYLTYLGSRKMFGFKVDELRRGGFDEAIVEVGLKPSEMVILGTDNGSAIFFRMNGQSDVYTWDTETAFVNNNFVLAQKGNDCRLSTHVAPGKKHVWTIESNFQDYVDNMMGSAGASMSLHPLVKSVDD